MSSMDWATKGVWPILVWEEVADLADGSIFTPVMGRRTEKTFIAPVVKVGPDDWVVAGKDMILSLSELRFELEFNGNRGFDGYVYLLREGSEGNPVYTDILKEEEK